MERRRGSAIETEATRVRWAKYILHTCKITEKRMLNVWEFRKAQSVP